MGKYDQIVPSPLLPRTSSCNSTTTIIPSYYTRSHCSSLSQSPAADDVFHRRLLRRHDRRGGVSTFLRSLFSILTAFPASLLPQCKWLVTVPSAAPSLGRRVTGTLFGNRRGHVSFAVQDDPGSEPVFVVELAVSTSALVREMSSGMVRIALECERAAASASPAPARRRRLFGEAAWKMYCNGKKCGQAVTRGCTESDWHVLSTVRRVSVGAGVIPVVEKDGGGAAEGERLYMRARFERVVGSRDSEAFYMLNPDGTGGPELSIFLLRI